MKSYEIRLYKLLCFVFSFFYIIVETICIEPTTIIIKKAFQLDNAQNTISGNNIYSSLEGHALILFQGYGLMNLQDYTVNCVFTDVKTSTFTYKSQVMKEKVSCDFNDYQCMYWQTSYQYSDTQIACYTPKVPEGERDKLMKATTNSAQMKISLEVLNKSSGQIIFNLNCATTSDCLVIYHPNMTANLVAFSPSHFYIGQALTMRVYPKSGTFDNLLGVKIGRNNCDLQVINNSNNNWNELLLNCLTMDNYIPEKITDFNINFVHGFSSVPFYFQKSDVDTTLTTNNKFYFKTYPRIDSLTINKGVNLGGQPITIKGAGFMIGKTKVYINNDECSENLSVTGTNLVSCVTPVSTINPSTNLNLGSNGLRWRIYSLTSGSINALNALAGFPDTSTMITKDDILLETITPKTFNTNYGQFINGYFKAPYSGDYTFWLTSDDASQLWLSTDSTAANKKLLIDYTSWTDYNDFITKNIKSAATTLVKDSYYYIEIKHVQGGGFEHFGLGVEIATTGIDFTKITTKPFANQIPRTVKISIGPKVSRNLYELVINSLTAGNYKFTCKSSDGTSTKSIDIDPTKTAAQLLSAIAGLTGQSELILRKIGYNDAKNYFLAANEVADDASYTKDYSFADMYINPSISTLSTGTKTGSVLLIFVDRKISDTTYAWENNCYLSATGSPTITISKKQIVSADITGNFSIKVTDTSTTPNTIIATPDIDVTNVSAISLTETLNYIPVLNSKVQVFISKSLETVNIFLRLSTSLSVTFDVVTTGLKGGRDDIPTATQTEFMPSSNNLFFFPIPADFLFVQNSLPQVRVVSNSFEAVCVQNKCGYTYIDANTLPSVTAATYDATTNAVTVTISKAFDDNPYDPSISLGLSKCGLPLAFNAGSLTYSCTLNNPIVAGKYKPALKTKYGSLKGTDVLADVTVPIKITSVTPKLVSAAGGTTLTIVGTGFPIAIDSLLNVKAGGADCTIQTVTNTQITCVTGIKSTEDPLTITYNTATVSATTDQFAYSAAVATNPTITSVSPSSVAPGEKQFMSIKFDKDINTYALSGISARIVSKNSTNYIIPMNPKDVVNDTLRVKFPGAKLGLYTLYVNLESTLTANGSPTFTSAISIDTISSLIGSINGGTTISLTGTNFLSTAANQVIFIGKTPCTYVTNNSTYIQCITQAANPSTQVDVDQPVVVEQMIQYASECKVATGCNFKYSTEKTAVINNIASASNSFIFSLNDVITINGSKFGFANTVTKLTFDWGEISITGGDYNTKIVGTVSKIDKYGVFPFKFTNDFGIATHTLTGETNMPGKSSVHIALKKAQPSITSITPNPVGEYGGIFSFFTDITDFASNVDSSGNILNTISICGKACTVLKTNIIPSGNNNIQCFINTRNFAASFTNCNVIFSYFGIDMTLPEANRISAVIANDYTFSAVNVDSTANPALVVKVTMNNAKIDFANLRLIVDNRYVFPAVTPGVLTSGKAVYTFNIANGLPAGAWSAAIHEDSTGYITPSDTLLIKNAAAQATALFTLNVPIKLTAIASSTIIASSFFGGVSAKIDGVNLNKLVTAVDTAVDTVNTSTNANFQGVYICGLPATVSEFKSSYIKFTTPTLVKYDIFASKSLVSNNQFDLIGDLGNLVEKYADTATSTNFNNLIDNNPYTTVSTTLSTSAFTFIGVRVKSTLNSNFKILLKKVKIFVGSANKPSDLDGGWIEGSYDGSTWIKISTIPKNLPFLWYTINIDYTSNGANLSGSKTLFTYVRFVPNINASSVAEIRFFGVVVYDSMDTTVTCPVEIKDNFNSVTVTNLSVSYQTSKTYTLSAVSPSNGSSIGGNTVKFSLSPGNSLTGSETISVKVFSNKITTSATVDSAGSPNSISVTMITRDNTKFSSTTPLEINIDSIGNVYCDTLYYQYLDRWSDTKTWGGEYIPANGETAYIKNTDVLLDVAEVNLNTLVIENGSLTVEDNKDYKVSAWNILVRSGKFLIGSENNRFKNKFELTMKSSKSDPTLPIFGNKVLAVMEGQLEIHGLVRAPVFTNLIKTAVKGSSTIVIQGPVDWKVGETIVIASSSLEYTEAEKRTISAIAAADSQSVTITLDTSLEFAHYGDLETYGSDVIDMRAEVGLLTRNIVIQGDENSETQQYGSHIMLTAMNMNMNTNSNIVTSGKISYIEVRRAGQAFQLGRYPIHFHMIGDVSGSYVKGCAIHHTFNRALTIHAVNNFLVENNIAYDVMGHTFFIEDAVETNNRIINNLGLVTRSSSSLLNTDYHPATFWITNPSNFFEGNHAAGSHHYGFWMDLPPAPNGLNLGVPGCPRDMPLGSFKNNWAHSNGQYGLRIFPEFNPKSKPCQVVDNTAVTTVQAILSDVTVYRNKQIGVIAERLGNVMFQNFKVADNPDSNMEVSDIIPFQSGMATNKDALIIGKSKNPIVDGKYTTIGFIAPRADKFLVDGMKLFNFGFANYALFSSCSRCEVSAASTDSDGRTTFFKNIKSDGSQLMTVKWAQPRRAIFRDLDGSLTGSTTPAWVCPYYVHNAVKECKRDPKFDDGTICDDTVQIRRVAFYEATPSGNFRGQPMKVMRVNGNFDTLSLSSLSDATQFANLPFKSFKDPNNGWAIPFVTGYNFIMSLGGVGLDFASIFVERSVMWEDKDKPLNVAFNYTLRRDEFTVSSTDNSGKTYTIANSTDITAFNTLTASSSLPYGTTFNNRDKRHVYMRINGLNPNSYSSNKLSVTAIQCTNNDCGTAAPNAAPLETFIRKWSDKENWEGGVVPIDGSTPVIKSGWNMMLDVSTANLKSLTVYGTLFWDPTQSNLELKANNIINWGRIEIGTNTTVYSNSAKITLTGNKFIPNIAVNNNVQIPNKALINLADISIYGEDRAPYASKLIQSALAGSTKVLVAKSLKWKNSDEILITTTTFNSSETERMTISSYNNNTGEVVLTAPLKFYHYGDVAASPYADNPLNPPVDLDERADVYMITRNIKISGSDEGWGCNVITSKAQTIDFIYVGKTNLFNAEISNCGQTDTMSAIHFEKHDNVRSVSNLYGLSFHSNPFSGITIQDSIQVNINSIIQYQQKRFGVYVMNSQSITLNDVNVVDLRNRTFPEQYKVNKIVDANACYYICPESNNCKDVKITNSTCAGSEFIGFFVSVDDCKLDYEKTYPSYNRAYASLHGFFVMNPSHLKCFKYGNAISYRNLVGYVSFVKGELAIHENILSAQNLQGIIIMTGSEKIATRKQLKKALIIGQNKLNPVCPPCIDGACLQYGMLLSVTAVSNGIKMPLSTMNFPTHAPKADASFGSFMDVSDLSIVNFEDQCSMKQFVFKTNEKAPDFHSVHNFKNLVLTRVLEDNLFFFENVQPNFDDFSCGNFPCTGQNSILVKVLNFKPSMENFDSSKITVNPKWTNSTSTGGNTLLPSTSLPGKKYIVPNFLNSTSNKLLSNTPTYPLIDNMSFIIYTPFQKLALCTPVKQWNVLACSPEKKMGILFYENKENEARSRSIAPTFVTDLDPYETFNNKLNSFMDHDCEIGYPSFLRTPIFPSLITMNKKYNITFASTIPNLLKFQLFDADWDDYSYTFGTYTKPLSSQVYNTNEGVVITIQYPSPITMLIYNLITGNEIKSKIWKDGENFTDQICGSSKWTPVKNTLEFFVSKDPTCVLLLKPGNSVQVSIRMDISIESFFSSKDNLDMIYKIAAVLNIPSEQLRITNVLKGSTIVQTHILEQPPAESITNDNLSTTASFNTTAPKINLEGVVSSMVSKIKDGSIILPGPVLDMSYTINRAVADPTSNSTSTNSTSTSSSVSDLSSSISFTSPTATGGQGTSGTATNAYPTTNSPTGSNTGTPPLIYPSKTGDKDSDEETRNIFIIVFTVVPVSLVGLGFFAYFMYIRKKKKQMSGITMTSERVPVRVEDTYKESNSPVLESPNKIREVNDVDIVCAPSLYVSNEVKKMI